MCNILKWFKPDCVDFTKPDKVVEVKIDRKWMDDRGSEKKVRPYSDDIQIDPRYYPLAPNWANLPMYSNQVSASYYLPSVSWR